MCVTSGMVCGAGRHFLGWELYASALTKKALNQFPNQKLCVYRDLPLPFSGYTRTVVLQSPILIHSQFYTSLKIRLEFQYVYFVMVFSLSGLQKLWSKIRRGVLSRSTRPCGAWLPTPPCGRGQHRFVTFHFVKLNNVLSNNYWLLEGGVNWGTYIQILSLIEITSLNE